MKLFTHGFRDSTKETETAYFVPGEFFFNSSPEWRTSQIIVPPPNQPGWRGTRAGMTFSFSTGPDFPSTTQILSVACLRRQRMPCPNQIWRGARRSCWGSLWALWARPGRVFWRLTRITRTPVWTLLMLATMWDAVLQGWPGSDWIWRDIEHCEIENEIVQDSNDPTILLDRFGLRGRDVHVVGHSLGAHLVGKIARLFEAETGQKVARVTGTGYNVRTQGTRRNSVSQELG